MLNDTLIWSLYKLTTIDAQTSSFNTKISPTDVKILWKRIVTLGEITVLGDNSTYQ